MMRAMRIPLLAATVLPLCLLVVGCGDDTNHNAADMSMSVPDLAMGPDMAVRVPDGVVCGSMSCAVGQSCCITQSNNMATGAACVASASACTSGTVLSCDGAEDCGGAGSAGAYCCGTIQFSGGTPDGGAPMFQGGDASCTGTCNFAFAQGSVTTRLCHQDVDCTGLTGPLGIQLDKCCSSSQAPGLHICATNLGGLGGMGITCP
jgi:hypothetical protein